MKGAIIQSGYLPWKGYFDIVNEVDLFVFLEDVQYTRSDWRNRNKIMTAHGPKWLSVPVQQRHGQSIFEARIDYSHRWQAKHKRAIQLSYGRAAEYDEYAGSILSIYDTHFETISQLNMHAIRIVSRLLGINTRFVNSLQLKVSGTKDDRVIGICQAVGINHYLSGPAARSYIDEAKFARASIALEYKDFCGYPEYRQLYGPFEHHVSAIDVLFNCGQRAPYYIWGWRYDVNCSPRHVRT